MIELRITSPSHKGLKNTLEVLEANFVLSKRSLPYTFRNKNTDEVKYTVYVAIAKWRSVK